MAPQDYFPGDDRYVPQRNVREPGALNTGRSETQAAEKQTSDPLSALAHALPAHTRLRAGAVLLWERLWPSILPPLCVLLAFGGLAFLDVFTLLPVWGHWLCLGLFAGLLALAIRRVWQPLHLPKLREQLIRIERDSGFANQPISTLIDDNALTGDAVSQRLWRVHLDRVAQMIGKTKVRWPAAGLADRDPFALRFATALLFVTGLMIAGPDAGNRLLRGLIPDGGVFSIAEANDILVDIWVAPPDYTGLPPVFLAGEGIDGTQIADPLALPAGTTLFARITGGTRAPSFRFDEGEAEPFEIAGGSQYHLEKTLTESGRFMIERRGRPVGDWSIAISPDTPPSIAFREQDTDRITADNPDVELEMLPPEELERDLLISEADNFVQGSRLVFGYTAEDDHGVTGVELSLTLVPLIEDERQATPYTETLRGSGSNAPMIDTLVERDLTPHPWAGLEVELALEAMDALEQIGSTGTRTLTLPAREFRHPLAQRLIEERRSLTLYPESQRGTVARIIRAMTSVPEMYGGDFVTPLVLGIIASRLEFSQEPDAVAQVQSLMWDLALRLEDGALGAAEREVDLARDALEQALSEDGVSEEEINQLVDQLNEALDRLFDAIDQELAERLARGEQLPLMEFDPDNPPLDRQSLAEMLEELRELSETGARDAAQELLAQLEQMIQQFQNSELGEAPEPDPETERLRELAQTLQDITDREQTLLDDTFRGRPGEGEDILGRLRDSLENTGDRNEEPRGSPDSGPDALDNRQPSPSTGGEQRQEGQEQSEQSGSRAQAQRPLTPAERRALENLMRADRQDELRLDLGDLMLDLSEVTEDIPENLGRAERAMREAEDALRGNQTARALQFMGEAVDELQQGNEDLQQQLQQRGGGNMAQPGAQGQGPGLRFGLTRQRQMGTGDGRDPLGRRPENEGRGIGSDVQVPDESDVQRAREILRELRRRSGEFERPVEELDYYDRLMERF